MGWCYDPLPGSCRLLNVSARSDEQRYGWRKFSFNRIELNHNLHTVKTVSVTILCTFHWQGVCILPKAKEKIHRRIDIRYVACHCAFIRSLATSTALRQRHLKSEVALLQTVSRLFHLVQLVKCWQFFWSWILKDSIKVQENLEKRKSLSCVHALHKTWN